MDEIIPKILNICFNSGLGTYLMFKELNEPCESKQEIPDKIQSRQITEYFTDVL